MPRLRRLEIDNFRCIHRLSWDPRPGFNALVGPGDIGKSTVLDAIDYCLGVRRTLAFTDADFHALDETQPIRISATIGELPDSLLDLDVYGLYLRGFDPASGELSDEPAMGCETVVTVVLTVDASLEPTWTLYSERAEAQDQQRSLSWSQRGRLAPIRLGLGAGHHLAWRQGSLLSRLTSDLPNASSSLAAAAREARRTFGDHAGAELENALRTVTAAAERLGINVGDGLKAMLDAESISIGRGTIALHTTDGVPLRCLGTGSLRLIVASLQQNLAQGSSTILIDELEHGLEPHRISRLLGTLGAKEVKPLSQVFLTTHSPVAIRELSGDALFVLREQADGGGHYCTHVGSADEVQGAIRTFPEALLARAVIVCEGASEVGLLRGLDQYDADQDKPTLAAAGVVPVDGKGARRVVGRAAAFQSLGFRTAILRDDDLGEELEGESEFAEAGGSVFTWQSGYALEDELFMELPQDAVHRLVKMAVEKVGEPTANANILSASSGHLTLADYSGHLTADHRKALGCAAKAKTGTWFKSISDMEVVGREVVGPALPNAGASLRDTIEVLRGWARDSTDS